MVDCRAFFPFEEISLALPTDHARGIARGTDAVGLVFFASFVGVLPVVVVNLIQNAMYRTQVARECKEAEGRLTPLLQQASDVDFRREFHERLGSALRGISWLRVAAIEASARPLPGAQDQSAERARLELESVHQLTPDCRALVVRARVRFFPKGKKKPAYIGSLAHLSADIDEVEPDSAVALWAADGARAYRVALRQGIDATMRLLQVDLTPVTEPDPLDDSTWTWLCARGLVNETLIIWNGVMVDRGVERIIYREESGTLWSLPTRGIEEHRGYNCDDPPPWGQRTRPPGTCG